MSIVKTGGVAIDGRQVGQPSPAGQFRSLIPVDFDRDEFTALLSDKGYCVTWEKATLCPNRPAGALAPLDHDINCTICDGAGFLYFGAADTKMLITGVRMDQAFHAYGRWDSGQVMVTALPEERIHSWDRITLQNGVARFYELVRRKPGTLLDKLKYAPLCVDHLSRVDRGGALQRYTADVDFRIAGGSIEWLIATGLPDDGYYYSVAYTYRPRYVVMDLLHQHRESTVAGEHYEFPTQAIARLDFLIRDESKDAAEIDDSDPFARR